ncbi:DYTN protein, partial [Zapornia atra]|nr:DYTN protein [Zapornia atra]
LMQIPAIVGESCTLSCVEIATRSCFHGVLNSAIVEEKFLSWLGSEPAILLLSVTEMVSHQARCRVCKVFPITGLRYRCLKCFNFDLCQVCFFTGRLSKPHKRSHPVVEHCVQMSAKANAKHFLSIVRNNLFQERCRRKEAQRRRSLEIVEERHFPIHKKTFEVSNLILNVFSLFPSVCSAPSLPALSHSDKSIAVPNSHKGTPRLETSYCSFIVSLYMKKQFSKWMDKMQFLYNCQEDKSCKTEAKLQSLRASHENLQMKLQQMKQEVKTMLQSSEHPLRQCQNMMPRNPHVLMERRMQGELKPAQIRPTSEMCADWKSLNPPNSTKRMQLLEPPEVPAAVDFMFSEDQLEPVSLESNRPFMGQHKNTKETQLYLPELAENSLGGIMRNTVLTPTAVQIPPDENEVSEEIELQQLVMKLKDELSLQAQPAQWSALQQEFFTTAERVCRSFSDLINQVTSS